MTLKELVYIANTIQRAILTEIVISWLVLWVTVFSMAVMKDG